MKKKFVLLLLSILFIWSCETKKQESQFLVVALNEMFPPFGYKGGASGEEMVGFDVELAKEIALDLEKTLIMKPMKFGEILLAVQNGEVDIALSAISITEERKLVVDFSTSYYRSSQAIVIRADNASFDNIRTKEQLSAAKKRLGAERASTGSIVANSVANGMPVVEINSFELVLLELLSGNIEAVVMDRDIARASAEKYNNLKVIDLNFDEEHYGVAVQKGNRELLNSINNTLARLVNSGDYMDLVDEYIKGYSQK